MKNVGERIKAARRARGLSKSALAQIIHSSEQTLDELEKGTLKTPSGNLLAELSRVLDVPPDWLLRGIGAAPAFITADDHRSKLINSIKSLNTANVSILLSISKVLLAHQKNAADDL